MISQTAIVQKPTGSPAPALARGIELLRLLESEGQLTLDAAAKATLVPKASLLRLFRTLEHEGLVVRRDGSYVATAKILPIQNALPGRNELIEDALARVASSTRMTAEWYVPSQAGMLLVKRAEAPAAEVDICARVGFLRPWVGELDAVATVGIAAFRPEQKTFAGHWTYVRDGVRGTLNAGTARKRVLGAAADGYAIDTILNPNGVRRMACSVPHLEGALAVAGHFAPSKKGEEKQDLQTLLTEARRLSSESKTGG